MNQSKILIATSQDFLAYTKDELTSLGFKNAVPGPGGLTIIGSVNDALFLNLNLRTCHHVLILLKNFTCLNPDVLYQNTLDIPWEDYIEPQGYVSVFSNVNTPSITDSRFANLKCKDAIVDRIAQKKGSRPDSGPNKDKAVIYIYWKNDECAIYLDTTGQTLSRRGYRKISLKTPMQEALAAAIIKATSWQGETNFINPMCGSGTLAIEAALIAKNQAPGLWRANFSFMHIKGFEAPAWDKMRKDSQLKETEPNIRIIATDIDHKAVETAKKNAEIAGVSDMIEFTVCDFKETPLTEEPGLIILNPEYGVRSGDPEQLAILYKEIGDFFKQKCTGYTGYVFSGNLKLLKQVGLKPKRKIPFHNGALECRLNEYELYEGKTINRTK